MSKVKTAVRLHWEYLGEGRYSCTANTVTGEGTSSHEALTRALLLLTAATGVERPRSAVRIAASGRRDGELPR